MYRTRTGDTFETVARRVYGDDKHAGLVRRANPGAVEPFVEGVSLATPPAPGAPSNKAGQAPSSTSNEVAVLIDGRRFRFWSGMRLGRSLDGMDTLEFSAPFEADAPGFRETFRPFSFKPLQVTVGGEPLFTGTLIGVTPVVDDKQRTISVSGYSAPGVLNDCTPPASAYPVEFDKQNLQQIAAALAEPFGLAVQFDADPGAAFERVAVDPGDKILDFLADLARQRSLVISSTADGALLFQQSQATGQPAATLREGASPVLSVKPSFSPQQYHSHITGLESVFVGSDGSQYTVQNPHLAGVLRPLTFKSPDIVGGDIKAAVAAKAGRMYGNMAAYSVAVSTWRDPAGNLWRPNTTVKLEAPGAMVYSPYEFVLRSVVFERDDTNETAELDLVLPGSFSGETPEAMPWD